MKRILIALALSLSFHARAQAQNPFADIAWTEGGEVGKLGSVAEIAVPEGYRFTGRKGAKKLMELSENIVSGNEVGFLATDDLDWFVVFEYDPVGYVRDDEKDSLDADAMLKTLKENTLQGNRIRARNGWAPMTILGWAVKPHYDETTHNLEWATRATVEGEISVNYNTRMLGRKGVMSVTLVCEPGQLKDALAATKELLKGYRYTEGNRYSEFRKGDKIAEYGLTALVAGGAAAVAVKSGVFKGIWKLLLVVGAAVAGFFKKLFGKKNDAA